MPFQIEFITAPLIGTVIGYFTNYLAVKMLFRPYNPIKIGRFTLPFTPGIIPKGKPRLASAIGKAVGSSLLTEEALQETLLSEEMLESIGTSIDSWLDNNRDNSTSLRELLDSFTGSADSMIDGASDLITEKILKKADEFGIGRIVAEQVSRVIREKTQGTMLQMMVTDNLLENISGHVSSAIDGYIAEHGDELVRPKVKDETAKFMDRTGGSMIVSAEKHGADIRGMILKIYIRAVSSGLGGALEKINIPAIIEKKINSMDMKEIEELTFSVMKKELDAIVWLGGVIGFILGLFNLLF